MHASFFFPPLQTTLTALGIPFGAWLAFNWDFGLHGLWIGLTVSLVYCSVFGTILCLRTDWNHEVDKVVARINAENIAVKRTADNV